MDFRLGNKLAWGIWALIVLGTIAAYPSLPAVMTTHFAANGEGNGTMGTLAGAFVLPLASLLILLIFTAIPHIDPLKLNIQKFRKQYDVFVALLMLFFAAVQALLIARNLGSTVNPMYVILPGLGVLVFYTGFMLPRTKRNWFIGIRTPWTISSDRVWERTHRLGGTLFKLLGIVIVLSSLAPFPYAIWIAVVPLIAVALGLILYSYVIYAQESKR